MKKYLAFIILSVGILSLALCTGTQTVTKKVSYTLDVVVGTVEVSTDNGASWKTATPGMALSQSASIRTGKSAYCDIIMPGRGILRVNDNAIIEISKLTSKVERLKVKKGKILANISEPLEDEETFEVETETAVCAVRGTKFYVQTDGKTTSAGVKKGKIGVKPNIKMAIDDKNLSDEVSQIITVEVDNEKMIEIKAEDIKSAEEKLAKVSKADSEKVKAVAEEIKKDQEEKISKIKDTSELNKSFSDIESPEKLKKVSEKKEAAADDAEAKRLAAEAEAARLKAEKEEKEHLSKTVDSVKKKAGVSDTASRKTSGGTTTIEEDIKNKVTEKVMDKAKKRLSGKTGKASKGIAEKKVGKKETSAKEDIKNKEVEKVSSGLKDRMSKYKNKKKDSAKKDSTKRRRPKISMPGED